MEKPSKLKYSLIVGLGMMFCFVVPVGNCIAMVFGGAVAVRWYINRSPVPITYNDALQIGLLACLPSILTWLLFDLVKNSDPTFFFIFSGMLVFVNVLSAIVSLSTSHRNWQLQTGLLDDGLPVGRQGSLSIS